MPIRQLTPKQEERLRLLQQLPRTALSVEQQRERLLLESVRASENAAKKAALLSVIRSNPTAPPEDIALKAAILYKQLKNPLTAQKALEQILAQEPNARVRRAMATAVAQHTDSPSLLSRVVNTVLLPLRALNWLNTQTTGRIWTGIKSAQEGEGFWRGFLHPEEYEEPIFTEEELPENWSPFMKKAVSLVTEIAGSILTDPLTYIGISKIPAFAKAGRWVDKSADVAEAAAKAAKTVEAAQEAAIAASRAARQQLQSWASLADDVVRKRVDDLLSGAKQAFEAYRQAVKATQPRWTLTWKIPFSKKELILADVQPLAERAKRVTWAVQNMPGIRPVAEWFTKHFRMLAPVPREKMSFEEFEKLSERIPELANVMRSIRGTADFVARKTLDEYLQKIPNDEVAKWVTHLAEVASDQVKSQKILSKIPQELRSEVLKGYSVYQKSIEETTKKMLEAFADAPGFFDNLLQDYVTHIILDPADVAKKKAKAFVARKYGIAEQIGKGDIDPFKVIIEQSRGPAQGSSPYFLRKRFFKTIADLKEAGIAVVDDIRIIDSVYKGVADQLMNLKNVEELLRLDGFIRPAHTVLELGWEAADKVFPWLKGQNLAIHPEIVRLFNNLKGTILPATDGARELRQLARAFDTVTNFFKGAVTSTRPSFHVMNTMGNMLLMRMAGIKYADQAKAIKGAISILLGKHPKAKEILEEFMKQGLHGHTVFTDFSVVPAEMAKELMDVLEATTGGIAKKIKTIVWPRRGDFINKVFAGPRWVGEQVDNVFRLAAFKHFLDGGLTPQQAAKLVRETLFDYSLLTTTERAIRRYVIPFYTWVRNALPRSIVTLLTQPGAVTGYEHMVNAFRKVLASSVDRSQLPEWLQDALILGTDEEGGILYLHPHPPWEELFSLLSGDVITQWFGQKQSESDPGRNLAAMIHPFWSAAWTLISGVDPRTGRKYPEEELSKLPVPIERLLAAAKQFIPWTEVERRIPQVSGRPRITTTKFLGSPVVRYDLPYAQAVEAKKASSLLDEVMQKLEAETGVPLPTTADVSQAERLIDRYSNYVRLIREAQSDPWKAQFINALIQGYTSPVAAMRMLQDNADLLLGSRAEVVMRLRKLLTPENFAKLRVYLGRTPSLKDFFEHRTALESGTLEAVSPEQRRAQALLEELERIMTYGQALQ